MTVIAALEKFHKKQVFFVLDPFLLHVNDKTLGKLPLDPANLVNKDVFICTGVSSKEINGEERVFLELTEKDYFFKKKPHGITCRFNAEYCGLTVKEAVESAIERETKSLETKTQNIKYWLTKLEEK